MIDHIRAEVARWWRRLDVIAIVLFVPAFAAWSLLNGRTAADQLVLGQGAQITDEARRMFMAPYLFPTSLITALTTTSWLNFAVFYLAAVTTGSDFAWGTIRLLALTETRARSIIGRWLFLVLLGSAMVLLLMIMAAVVGLVTGVRGDPEVQTPVSAIGLAVIGALGSMSLFAAAGVAAASFARNATVPLVLLAAYVLAEMLLSSMGFWRGGVLEWIPRLLPGNAGNALVVASQLDAGLITDPSGLPSHLLAPAWVSLAAIAGWIGIFVFGAVTRLRSMDIVE